MSTKERHNNTISTQSQLSHPCTSCVSSQMSSLKVNLHRPRRSNSCPGNSKDFPTVHTKGSITKRWHSIPTVYLHTTDFSLSDSNIEYSSNFDQVQKHREKPTSAYRVSSLGKRVTSLFALGVLLAVLLNYLQKQKRVTIFSPGLFGDVLNSAWWIPPTFGLAATVIGLLYPKLDQLVGNEKMLRREWSSVMRCIAVFVGINHASVRINFDSNVHLSLALAILSLGLWYFFDQSITGLGLGLLITGIATVVTQVLVAMNVFGYSNPDFLYMQSWVPWLYFSGGVTIGTFGRALAPLDGDERIHYHMD